MDFRRAFNNLAFLGLVVKVLVLRADLEDCLEHCVKLTDSRCLCGFLDKHCSECGHPLQKPVIVTFAQKRLKEVRQSLKVLLVLIVIGDVANHSVAFLSRFGVS